MAKHENMRLCGGTFLVLLFEAKRKGRRTQYGQGRPSEAMSNPDLFGRLVLTVNPDFKKPSGRSFNTFTTEYKMCRDTDTPYVGLTDDHYVRQFNEGIKTKYYEKLLFFFTALESAILWDTKGPWLVAALLDLIDADDTIPADAEFHVRPYGQTVTKAELRNIECICIPAFVFGVWHYIITKVQDNKVGVHTLDMLLENATENHGERKFTSDIGNETLSTINTSVDTPDYELKEYHNPALEAATKNMPFAFIAPGVAADVRNIKAGQVFVNSSQVFYLDGEEHEAIPSYDAMPFDTYLGKATEFYTKVKTLLYSEAPRNFRDLYVPNDVTLKSLNTDCEGKIKSRPIEVLAIEHFGNIIIRGTGGIGKSMMMRHLFLHFAEKFSEIGILPVLVTLKNFTNHVTNLETFIFNAAHEFDHDLTFEDFEPVIKTGKCLVLLDGLDEIPGSARHHFDNILVSFTKAYQRNHIVVSSRPTSNFAQFGHFLVFDVEPFSKEKALELIDKLEYHDPESKAKFRDDLDKKLYRSHQQFASNPLLLTIMLMTYTSYGEVPAKRHVFYAKAYETMARLHDASKGAYVRPMHTGLTPEDFAVYFAEFCARTYRAEVLEFNERIFNSYMEKVIQHQHRKIDATPRDFLLDLTENLCIMYKEGEKYYFIHRSFQEYFSAVFFSNQMDDQLERIGVFFENQRHRQFGDRTFDMMYDMIPNRIDRYIFLPFLKNLWKQCDSKDGYWTFLCEMYSRIYAQEGNPGDFYENDPESYLYDFIVNETLHRHNGELYNVKWPDDIDYCNRKEWVSIEKGEFMRDGKRYVRTETVELDEVDYEYIDEYGEPEIEGVSWEIDVSEIRRRSDFFAQLIAFMEDDSFPLKKEYNEMRQFTEWLDKTINEKPSSDDWFDSF